MCVYVYIYVLKRIIDRLRPSENIREIEAHAQDIRQFAAYQIQKQY